MRTEGPGGLRTTHRRATTAEKIERDLVTYEAWGTKLTREEYLLREHALRAHPYADAAMDTWLLLDGGAVLSSLETFRGDAVAASGQRGHCYGVASVFTEALHRGNGYATALLSSTLRTLADEDPRAMASVLFSDVGAALYERSGYRAIPGDDLIFSAAESAFVGEAIPRGSAPAGHPGAGFSLVATPLQIDWHHERQALYAAFLGRREPPSIGVRLGDHHAVWLCDFKHDRLLLLSFSASEAAAPTLLATARHVAHQAGLADVVAWASEGIPEAAARLGRRAPRVGTLVMVASLRESPVDPMSPVSRSHWC